MSEQLILDLPVRPALGRADFFVSSSNKLAVSALDNWQNWPLKKLVLTGPEGSGKTHLAHVWATELGAQVLSTPDLAQAAPQEVTDGPLVVEDIDRIPNDSEQGLFHIHNMMAAAGQPLLLTSRRAPVDIAFALPDLASRMQGTSVVALNAPDDDLLAAVILKRFADLQVQIAPNVIPYLLTNIDRSFASAHHIVDALDQASLREGRRITRPLAATVLKDHAID